MPHPRFIVCAKRDRLGGRTTEARSASLESLCVRLCVCVCVCVVRLCLCLTQSQTQTQTNTLYIALFYSVSRCRRPGPFSNSFAFLSGPHVNKSIYMTASAAREERCKVWLDCWCWRQGEGRSCMHMHRHLVLARCPASCLTYHHAKTAITSFTTRCTSWWSSECERSYGKCSGHHFCEARYDLSPLGP